jgi:non-ribosomal peptide synthetase component F
LHRLAEGFQTLLGNALQNPQGAGGQTEPASRRGTAPILYDWNRTEYPYDRSVCMHELFEAQVRRTPDAPAVCFGDAVLTYAALNRKANRLADRLRRAGVGPDVLVGICTEKSLEMVHRRARHPEGRRARTSPSIRRRPATASTWSSTTCNSPCW